MTRAARFAAFKEKERAKKAAPAKKAKPRQRKLTPSQRGKRISAGKARSRPDIAELRALHSQLGERVMGLFKHIVNSHLNEQENAALSKFSQRMVKLITRATTVLENPRRYSQPVVTLLIHDCQVALSNFPLSSQATAAPVSATAL